MNQISRISEKEDRICGTKTVTKKQLVRILEKTFIRSISVNDLAQIYTGLHKCASNSGDSS